MEYIRGEKFKSLSNNKEIFYCHTHDVNSFFDNLNITQDFILISHNSDGKITDQPGKSDADVRKMPKNLIRWYAQNVCYKDDRIISLPIGLENSEWFVSTKKVEKITNKILENKKHKKLVYVNHNIQTNPKERIKPYTHLQNKDFATIENGLNGQNFDNYLDNLYNHKFVVCPEGNGTDTHRTWECLYINTIPIEKRNINNQFYTDLPICFVDDWEEITEEFLNSEYERITKLDWNLEKLDFNYWKNRIKL
jgi:hypothetical protein